jgi:two-component system, OmpR family, alkaline phosphatase synthesis response regulator PhoP
MPVVMIITGENEAGKKLQTELSEKGFSVTLVSEKEKIVDRVIRESPELIMLEMNGQSGQSILHSLTHSSKIRTKIPLFAMLAGEALMQPADYPGIDDFIVRPYDAREIAFRIKRQLQKKVKPDEVLYCGDLVIDMANCEVRVEGKVVELTFKEYELLRFLAQDKGRVYSREALLNKVWGYDYFGGDRTVDVHIRRLRSKVELSGQTFIETVRNIGYRFTKRC